MLNVNMMKITIMVSQGLYTLLLVLSSFLFTDVFAGTKTFTGTGNFSNAANWNGNTLPVAGDDIRINGTCTVDNSVLTDNVAYTTLIVGNGLTGSLSWAVGGTNRLNVFDINGFIPGSNINMTNGGTLIVRGTITETYIGFTGGAGTVERRLPVLLTTLPWVFNNLIINTTGTISTGIAITINGNLTVTSGTFSIGGFNFAVNGTTTVTGTLAITSTTGTKTFKNLIINGTFNNSVNDAITITGNLTNNGTFTQGTGRVTFTGAASNTVTGTAATTAFGGGITVNKGPNAPASTANVLDVQCVITMPNNGLTLTTGTFKLSSNSTIKPFTTDNPNFPYLIPNAAGLWCNGGVINTDDDCTTDGLFRISNGVFNLGSAVDNRLRTVNCFLTVEGGALNIAGRITPTTAVDACTFVMTGGTMKLATVGSGSLTKAPFDMTNGASSFTMSGGTIIIEQEGGTGPQQLGFNLLAGTSNVTGGTLQMGDALTPVGDTMKILTSVALWNLVVNSANVVVLLDSFATTTFKNDVTITAGELNAVNLNLAVGGNWTNNSTFTPTIATVIFNGAGTSTLGGLNVTTFYNLTLNTPATTDIVQLLKTATVTSVLTLTKGVFDLNSKQLFVSNGVAGAITRTSGFILSEKTDNSSKLKWNINNNLTSHTFPFGTAAGSYIPFILNLTAGNIGSVTLSTYPTPANNTPYPTTPILVTNLYGSSGADNSANTVDRFWQIDKTGASGTATLTFTATSAEVGSILLPTAQRYETLTNKWQSPLPGQTSTATSATVPGVTTFSPWTLSSQSAILPIQLVSFNAAYTNPGVLLNWVTESEINSDYFVIERTIDESTFEWVCQVKAAGESFHTLNYQATDTHPASGLSYYRLKQVDLDGTASYSDLVVIEFVKAADKITVFPNPVTNGMITVRLQDHPGETILISVMDLNGKMLLSKTNKLGDATNSSIVIDELGNLPKGLCILRIAGASDIFNQKITVY